MICSNCGADNRESAKFCAKCAKQLVPLWPATVQLDEPTPRKRRRRHADEPPAPAGPRLGLYLLAGLLLIAVTGWAVYAITSQMSRQRDAQASAPPAMAATEPASAPAPAPTRATTPPAPSAASAPEPTPVAAPSAPAPAHPEPHPRAKPPAKPRQAASAPAPVAPQPAAPEPAAPPPPAPAPAPASAPAPVAALCADSSLFAHALCLQRECSRPGMRQHPQCVRMREQQQALREGSGN